jgi:hypothetical protein
LPLKTTALHWVCLGETFTFVSGVISIYLRSYLRKTGLLASTFGLGGGLKTFTPHGLLKSYSYNSITVKKNIQLLFVLNEIKKITLFPQHFCPKEDPFNYL